VGVDTLEAVAMKVPFARYLVCPVLDARKGEVFGALFRPTEHGLQRLTSNLVLSPEAFCSHIREPAILLGSGAEVYRHVWQARLGERAMWAPEWIGMPCSIEVGILACGERAEPHGHTPSTLEPAYIRLSEAERNWSRRQIPEQPSM